MEALSVASNAGVTNSKSHSLPPEPSWIYDVDGRFRESLRYPKHLDA